MKRNTRKGEPVLCLFDPPRRSLKITPSLGHMAGSTSVIRLKAHPDWPAAKTGDAQAAIRLVADLISEEKMALIREHYPRRVRVVPVVAVEACGSNQIPIQVARRLADILGGEVDLQIFQLNRAAHTNANMMGRLISRPVFKGFVVPGARYLLADDVVISGNAFAELASYIVSNGGIVAGMYRLAKSVGRNTLAPEHRHLQAIRANIGRDVIEEALGISINHLTQPEAKVLARFKDADTFQARVAREYIRRS